LQLLASFRRVALSFGLTPMKGVSTAAWTSSGGLAELGKSIGNNIINVPGYGVLGGLAAIVFRSPATAISVGVAYVLPIQIIVTSIWHQAGRSLPGQLLQDIANGGRGFATAYGDAGLRVLCYGAVAVLVSAVLFRLRDMTS
jgi:hypothetical protein